jgi:NAD(P)-dependent dehydrogenase (short-subunit alcohol dehydrogenase family)
MNTHNQSHQLLQGKHILITGAGRGIGQVVALKCAQMGARVILLSRNLAHLEEVYDQIIDLNYSTPENDPILIHQNLTQITPEQSEGIAISLQQEIPCLDGLLHNAAQLGPLTLLEQYAIDTWDSVFKVNVGSVLQLTQSLLPLLKRSPHASVIMTGDKMSQQPQAFWGAYGISKYALLGLMQAWAQEASAHPQLRFNMINPGATRTALRAEAFPGENPQEVSLPAHILPAYLYLLSDASIGLTGQMIDAATFVGNSLPIEGSYGTT